MLALKLLSRNIPALAEARHVSQAGENTNEAKSEKAEKTALAPVTRTSWSPLSLEETNRAQALANITTNYQRPDSGLIEAMKKKQQQQMNAGVTYDPSSTEFSSLLPTVAGRDATPASPSRTPASNTSKKRPEWEDKAQQIIEREGLSLDRDWSRLSWKQKASNIVRLKLLKNDGYDISALLGRGTSADQIIDALLAHVEARKKDSPCRDVSAPVALLNWGSGAERRATGKATTGASVQRLERRKTGSIPTIWRSLQRLDAVDAECRLARAKPVYYATRALISQKRKHNHDDDEQPAWHETQPRAHLHAAYQRLQQTTQHRERPCTCGLSAPKMQRLEPPSGIASALQEQAYHLHKWRLTRSIFRSARATRSALLVQTSTHLTDTLSAPPKPSRILFVEHDAPGTRPSGADAYISSVALRLIRREVECLAWSFDERDRSYCIHDYDASEDVGENGRAADGTGSIDERSFQHDIRWTADGECAALMEGEPRALVGLLGYLRTSEMFHLGRWGFGDVRVDEQGRRDEQMRVLFNYALPMHLSPATNRALEKIGAMLEAGQDVGGDEVRVGVVRRCARFSC